MLKKILYSLIITILVAIIIGGTYLVLHRYNQLKETDRQVLNFSNNYGPIGKFVEEERGWSEEKEKKLNKLIQELKLNLPPTDSYTYTDDYGEISFSIPHNPNWGGDQYYFEFFEKDSKNPNFIYFKQPELSYFEMSLGFWRGMFPGFSKMSKTTYETVKKVDYSTQGCGKATEEKIGENIFLAVPGCGMGEWTEYYIQGEKYTYKFDAPVEVLESVKLIKIDKKITTTYKNEKPELSFDYPNVWGTPNIAEIKTDDLLKNSEDTEIDNPQKLIKNSTKINFTEPSLCKTQDNCKVYILITPYNQQQYFIPNCQEQRCLLGENLLDQKAQIEKEANMWVSKFPALLVDERKNDYTALVEQRSTTFFTPQYRVVIFVGAGYVSNIKEQNKEELNSVLQEFMNMVDSFKIER